MVPPKSTIWSMDRHTQAKHEILRRYFGAWLPILINHCGRARIIDGFAGPGEYADGQIGSPLIALQTLLIHPDPTVQKAIGAGTVDLIFIEQDQKRSAHLRQLLVQQKQEVSYPASLQPRIIGGTFAEEMAKQLTIMEQQRTTGKPIPTFVFIDPFGFSHTPLDLIARIMRLPMCEVLITFMAEEINRFLTVDYRTKDQQYDQLFGTQEWRQITQHNPDPGERQRLQHDLYRHQLLTAGGAHYVRPFRMCNRHNATDYFLFFCTNSLRGLAEMKRAMWSIDQSGNFEFSDYSNPYQPLLLNEINYGDLQHRLTHTFKGNTVSLAEIKEYVLADTPYYYLHKQKVLKPMEQDTPPKIRVINPEATRMKGTFPNDSMLIEFL